MTPIYRRIASILYITLYNEQDTSKYSAVLSRSNGADKEETLFGKSLTPAERLRQHQRSLQKAQRELEREKSKLEAQEKKTMADIKKNAKAGNMVRQAKGRLDGSNTAPGGLDTLRPSFACRVSTGTDDRTHARS